MACLVVVAEGFAWGFEHLSLLEVKTERTHGDLQLVVVDRCAILVHVKELKHLFDLLLLLFGELVFHGGVCVLLCVQHLDLVVVLEVYEEKPVTDVAEDALEWKLPLEKPLDTKRGSGPNTTPALLYVRL